MKDLLVKHFNELELPKPAIEWLLMLWHVTQVFDDVADGDEVKRDDLDDAIYFSLVGMNVNAFFKAYSNELLPVVANFILKWQGSDTVERAGEINETSFVWRAGYFDVVMMVVLLCHGQEKAKWLSPYVLKTYGEDFQDYVKEFKNG